VSEPTTTLQKAMDAIADRGRTRDPDSAKGERSMATAVATFNALTGHALSEVDGWHFMLVLKQARAQGGAHNPDDYVDIAGYAGLAEEAADRRSQGGGDG